MIRLLIVFVRVETDVSLANFSVCASLLLSIRDQVPSLGTEQSSAQQHVCQKYIPGTGSSVVLRVASWVVDSCQRLQRAQFKMF